MSAYPQKPTFPIDVTGSLGLKVKRRGAGLDLSIDPVNAKATLDLQTADVGDLDNILNNKAQNIIPETGTSASKLRPAFDLMVLREFINPMDAKWGGGCKLNGVDDDSAALDALSAAYGSQNQYAGGGPEIVFPYGQLTMATKTWDISGMHGIGVRFGGRGSGVIKWGGNFPAITARKKNGAPLTNFKLAPVLLYGPGAGAAASPLVNAHGLDLVAPFSCEFDVQVWAARDAIRCTDAFGTTLNNPLVNGQGGLACYRGLYMPDGDTTLTENGLTVRDGLFGYCTSVGIRAEKFSGSVFNGTQSFGHGEYGWYFGDSPAGLDGKWPIMDGVSGDTCGKDLFLFSRGASNIINKPDQKFGYGMALGIRWIGNAYADGFCGVRLVGVERVDLDIGQAIQMPYVVAAIGCKDLSVSIGNVSDYDYAQTKKPAILCQDTTDSSFQMGRMHAKAYGNPDAPPADAYSIVESGTSRDNAFGGANTNLDRAVSLRAAGNSRFTGHVRTYAQRQAGQNGTWSNQATGVA
ncbi:hypothetical protein ASG63_09595 [Methylobacterium sp. Leaf94]|uniref:hypothetical protein n=1 Tax=Methylobacterium sp. Leaf94 TaxID=1736250 RepID=UPI0006F9D6A5|nr:hypothetical protein [Methylobacterium sp. Leaf94]KQU17732.1 hypothetical protein ASG63_09595 [Methylobacterium sp. Leaf94]